MIELNKVKSTWSNVIEYYLYINDLNSKLIKYINNIENSKILSIIKINENSNYMRDNPQFNIKDIKPLLRKILQSKDINYESYKNMIKSNEHWYASLSLTNLDEDKIYLLLNNRMLQFTVQNFSSLKDKNLDLHIKLLENFKSNYLKNMESIEIDSNDLIKLLKSNGFTNSEKKVIINYVTEYNCSLINSDEVSELIYKLDDKKNTEKSYEYILNMINSLKSIEKKITLLNIQNEFISNEQFIEILTSLPDNYSKISNLDGKQTLLILNDYNKKFIEMLKSKGFITSSKPDKNNKKKMRLWIKNKEE